MKKTVQLSVVLDSRTFIWHHRNGQETDMNCEDEKHIPDSSNDIYLGYHFNEIVH